MDLEKIINQKLHKTVIAFFFEHPSAIETEEGISLWTGLPREKLKRVLGSLARSRILIADTTSSPKNYAFTHDAQIIKKLRTFFPKKAKKK